MHLLLLIIFFCSIIVILAIIIGRGSKYSMETDRYYTWMLYFYQSIRRIDEYIIHCNIIEIILS